jgi:hypothetical protein
MPLSVDIFNKKILSDQSRFGKYNILLSGDIIDVDLPNYYTRNNPSGYITAQNVVFTTGNQTISGNKTFTNDITVQGAVLVNQVIDITTTGAISGITGEFKYIKTEGGLVSGGDFEVYADEYTFSGVDVNFYGDEYIFSGVNVYINDGTGFFTSRPIVNGTMVALSGESYPRTNPSGYITTANLSKIIDKFTPSQNQPPSTGFARFDTRNSILVLDFNDTTNESGTFVGSIPDTANISNGLNVRVNWSAVSGTSGSCVWGARFMNLNTDLDIDSFDVAGFGSGVANATNGVPTVTQITCTGINGLTTGSFYRMLVFRNSADTVNDTMLGDAEINFIEVRAV